MHRCFLCALPAAKCRGVDLRPAVSLAFTDCGVINFFTRTASPVLQASNNSRRGSVGAGSASSAEPSIERRLDILFSRFTFSFDVAMCLDSHFREFIEQKHVHTAGEACTFFDSSRPGLPDSRITTAWYYRFDQPPDSLS